MKSKGMSNSRSKTGSRSSAVKFFATLKSAIFRGSPTSVKYSLTTSPFCDFLTIFILKRGYRLASSIRASLTILGSRRTSELRRKNTIIFYPRRFSSVRISPFSRGPIGRPSPSRKMECIFLFSTLVSANTFEQLEPFLRWNRIKDKKY